ncbi:MAG: hypothetical protein NTX73_02700 [Rhodobacterales bacterium]|jgi:hypothetical protein|nr:hypothetical protein [Rhodobacterales bacterium]
MQAERRYGEPFACGPGLKLEAHEKMAALQFAQLAGQMHRLEAMMERLEKRLWLTVYGVVAVMLTQAVQSILTVRP